LIPEKGRPEELEAVIYLISPVTPVWELFWLDVERNGRFFQKPIFFSSPWATPCFWPPLALRPN
jgi:hypothetical protein